MKQKPTDLDFNQLLTHGAKTYDTLVGQWWQTQSQNQAHKNAYKHISQTIQQFYQEQALPSPDCIVDYASGSGALLRHLHQTFPQANLVGLDGSESLLQQCALQNKSHAIRIPSSKIFQTTPEPIRLAKCVLPDFKMPQAGADLLVFAFPNLLPDENHIEQFNQNGYTHRQDSVVAQMLARFREMDPEDQVEVPPPDELYDDLMTQRVYSRHLRHLVKPGAIVVRIEYSQAPRAELSDLTRWRLLFAEGALDVPIKGKHADLFFQYLGSQFKKSKVILDVFHQTQNPDDARGGYMVNFFKALGPL